MEPMNRMRKIVTWHLVGLVIILLLVAFHLAMWNMDCAAWRYCLMGAIVTGVMTLAAWFMGE